MSRARRLVVMRHAKAEPYAATDFARRLTDRGHQDAVAAGAFLAEAGIVPDHAVVSGAARTRATWEAVRGACGSEAEAQVDHALYAAQPDTILETLRLSPESAATVIFVGHNPEAAHLAYVLDDGEGDPEVVRGLLEGFPTAALAVFDLPGPWHELTVGRARITHFHAGRRLPLT